MPYKRIVSETFYNHGVNNKELENAMIELFSKFESHILSDRFVNRIDTKLKENEKRRKSAWGG